MPEFSKISMRRLATCHPDLQRLFLEVVRTYDCTVVCGHRGVDEQNAAVSAGRSRLPWPQSKHNKRPALAVDVAPYFPGKGIDWRERPCRKFAKHVLAAAKRLKIPIRWGGDWNGDGRPPAPGTLVDLTHFELTDADEIREHSEWLATGVCLALMLLPASLLLAGLWWS